MKTSLTILATFALLAAGGGVALAADGAILLAGDQEVPAVTTTATGAGQITVAADKSVHGSVKTKGIAGTMAHIHLAAPGVNGPVVITLTKSGDDEWSVPADAKLSDDQFAAFQAGNLYVNVHSDGYMKGEIRAQLKP